jgi:hypothetical protein
MTESIQWQRLGIASAWLNKELEMNRLETRDTARSPKRTSLAVALVIAAACSTLFASRANAAPPVPFYTAHVTKVDKQSAGTVVITTKDSVEVVCAWYRKNLRDQNGEHTTADGAHIFYTHNGATVDVEPGNRFSPGTTIGLVWDAKKFGPYTGK